MIAGDIAAEHLSADEVDDVLYLARANEAEELKGLLSELAEKYKMSQGEILESCVDKESANTAIHLLSANGHNALLQTTLALLQHSAKARLVNQGNSADSTPLHWASVNGHLETVKVLIEAEANLWHRNQAGNLAVFEAERAGKDDVVAFLLKVGGTERENDETAQKDAAEEAEEFTMSAGDMSRSSSRDSDAVHGAQQQMEKTTLDG